MTNPDRPATSFTKREVIAKEALAAFISNRELQKDLLKDVASNFYPKHIKRLEEVVSFEAIQFADELLKQLGEPK